MAEAGISVAQDQFSCPICLDLLRDPVSIPCGHSFCMVCINSCWDQEDQSGIYSCPQCRHSFSTRPVVGKNTLLADVVEKLKLTRFQAGPSCSVAATPSNCSSRPEDVDCDVCAEKAVKSCLVCLASYCEGHLQPHYKSPALKKHKLVKASKRLREQICSQHEKLLEVYCRTDQQCICMLCMLDEHKGHDMVSAEVEKGGKEKQLVGTQKQFQEQIKEKQQELQELRKTMETHKRSAQAAVEDSERIFTELIRSIERKRSEVTELIRAQEKAAVGRAEDLLKQLEQDIAELKRRDAELEELSHTEDTIYFLQSFPSLSAPSGGSDSSPCSVSPLHTFENVAKSVSRMKGKLEEFWEEELRKTEVGVKGVQIVSLPDPQSREDFLEYFYQLTLDPNTTNKLLRLSEGSAAVTCSHSVQPYNTHAERFDEWRQVLCRESVCGRCYWEVEWSGAGGIDVAVAYKSIRRKGNGKECLFGFNDHSWRLLCCPSIQTFKENNNEVTVHRGPVSSRIGVFVDHRAGTLSFYSISDTMSLLHRVHTTFTQPLYAGFGLSLGSTVNLPLPAK